MAIPKFDKANLEIKQDFHMIDRSHGGNMRQFLKSSRRAVVDFSVNINPLGIPEEIKNSIINNVDKVDYYPEPESKYVKDNLAKYHALSDHNFLVGNGSIELIHLIPQALKEKAALIPVPTFSEYEFAAKANNTKCLFIKSAESDNFKIDMPRLIRLLPKSDLVFICNPNNPTGSALMPQETLSLIRACEDSKITLVIDEAFIDFMPRANKITMISESAKNKHLLILRSLTKIFALPGIRIGYLAAHKDTIDKLSRHVYPWNVNTLAQIAAAEAIKDTEYIKRTEEVIAREKKYLFGRLNDMNGIKVYPSEANFFLCKLTPLLKSRGKSCGSKEAAVKNVTDLSKKLIRDGIAIRNCNNFRGLNDGFFRIAVRKRDENRRLLAALGGILR